MGKINFKFSQTEFKKIAGIAEQYSRVSLAAKISKQFKIETAFSNLKKFEGIHNQVIKAIRQDQKNLQRMLKSPVLDLANQAAKQSQQIERLVKSASFNAFREINKQNEAIREAVLATSSIAAHAVNKFQDHINYINLQSINSIASSISKLNAFPSLYKEIENSFSIKLFRQLEKDNISFDNAVDAVQEAFKEKADAVPESLITFEGMIQLLFAFIFFIYAMNSSVESEKRIQSEIRKLEYIVLEQIDKLKPKKEEAVYYVIQRPVNLRSKPNTKFPIITILYPNQRVELIQRKGKWIYIKYFDYIDGIPRLGWVYKKYAKMLK